MFLTLFAFAVAMGAIIRGVVLSGRVRRLRDERDRLMATVDAQRRQIAELRGNEAGAGSVGSLGVVHPAPVPQPAPALTPAVEAGTRGPEAASTFPVAPAQLLATSPIAPLPAAETLAPTPFMSPAASDIAAAGRVASFDVSPALETRADAHLQTPTRPEPLVDAAPATAASGDAAIAARPVIARGETPGPALQASPREPEEAPKEKDSAPADWESFLGIKGAAWLAGIAFMLSALFFARWTISQGLITAKVGFAVMLLLGMAALAAGEGLNRAGPGRATSPVLGGGLAILYAVFMAGHSRYGLVGAPASFTALFGVTIAGGLLAVRHDAFAPALLSLLGGIATAFALASNEGQTLGAFTALLLLNLGLLFVVARRPWFGLLSVGLLGTLALQIRWFWNSLSPETMVLGAAIALVFGIFYLVLPTVARHEKNPRALRVSALGAGAPFLFAFILATSARYLDQWPILFGMVALLNLATLIVSVRCCRAAFLLRAAIATALLLGWWALQGLKAESSASLFGSTLFAVVIVAIFGVARRVALRLDTLDEAGVRVLESAALAAGIGLGLFGVVMILYDRGAPFGPFLTLATALVLLLVEMSEHEGRLRGALAVGALGLATLTQIWLFSAVNATTLVSFLAGPVVVSLLLWFLAERRADHGVDIEAEIAVQAAAWIAILGLFLALVSSDRTSTGWPLFLPLASTGWPLFLALLIQLTVVTASVRRSGWTIVLPALVGASALHVLLWQSSYLSPDQLGITMAFTLLLYAAFLALPLLRFSGWGEAAWPWISSALAGPAFYFPLRALYRAGVGEASVGLVPLAQAALTAGFLAEVSRRLGTGEGETPAARLRLGILTLYTAVALWLLAAAVQIQFDRQWLTLGWAILAVALCWLFGRLPHRGLIAFAAVLYAMVGARLLFNPAVLEYEPRGLPVFNWLLYTYVLAGACFYAGQRLLRRASADRWVRWLADSISFVGLLFGFWLVNLEILDYFSPGEYITLSGHEGYSVKLAFSVGWGVFAVALLGAGVARQVRPLRYLSLAFMILTVAKVFLYDLSALEGFFQVFSLFGLAAGLLLVSFFYQRFVFRRNH